MIYHTESKGMSLVEQKKLQWAKEREELAKLSEVFTSSSISSETTTRTTNRHTERTSIRTYYSTVDLTAQSQKQVVADQNHNSNSYVFDRASYADDRSSNRIHPEFYGNAKDKSRDDFYSIGSERSIYNNGNGFKDCRVRSPSLPPIGRLQIRESPKLASKIITQTRDEEEADTSGYLSDSANNTCSSPELVIEHHPPPRMVRESVRNKDGASMAREQKDVYQSKYGRGPDAFDEFTPESSLRHNKTHSVQSRPTRSRNTFFGDESSDLGHETDFSISNCYETPSSSSSSETSRNFPIVYRNKQPSTDKKQSDERAKWGDRGVTIGHLYDMPLTKDMSKGGPEWLDRGLNDSRDSGDESVVSYSFIRGQNAPIDPKTLSERALKRLRALELQTAIKEQLAERDMAKKREAEIRQAEEFRQEQMLKRQLSAERKIAEREQRKQQEKIEKEKQKQGVMRAALERAADEARIEKEKRKRDRAIALQMEATSDKRLVQVNTCIEDEIPIKRDGTLNSNLMNRCQEPHESDPDDDSDKILIGSPIKFRKKNLMKTKKSAIANFDDTPIAVNHLKSSQSDIVDTDRSSTPNLVPQFTTDVPNGPALIFPKDSISLNNLQFAVVLAQQMELFRPSNPMFQQFNIPDPVTKTDNDIDKNLLEIELTKNSSEMDAIKILSMCKTCRIKSANNMANETVQISEDLAQKEQTCFDNDSKKVDKKQDIENFETPIKQQTEQLESTFTLPHDGTFTKETILTKSSELYIDVATQTDEIYKPKKCTCLFEKSIVNNIPNEVIAPSELLSHISDPPSIEMSKDNIDEIPYNETSKANCKTHIEEINDQQPVEVETKSDSDSEFVDELSKETTTTTTTTTTSTTQLIRSKTKDQLAKIEERPKWGVNRPLQQYVKASDRDPFYLRKSRKKCLQKRLDSEHISEDILLYDGPSSSTSAHFPYVDERPVVTRSRSSSPEHNVGHHGRRSFVPIRSSYSRSLPKLSRSMCTEIVPIKTDMNGKIYLNFQDASVVMSEKQVKSNLRKRYHQMERIMSRRVTTADVDGNNDLDLDKPCQSDVEDAVQPRRSILPRALSKRILADVDMESY